LDERAFDGRVFEMRAGGFYTMTTSASDDCMGTSSGMTTIMVAAKVRTNVA
jgi:hypothetical protein